MAAVKVEMPAVRLHLLSVCSQLLVCSMAQHMVQNHLQVGLGEGFAPSAATSVLAWQVPSTERSRAVTTVWGGLDVGSAVGLLLSGPLIRMYGWPSVFYLFAVLGGIWCLLWPLVRPSMQVGSAARSMAPWPASILSMCVALIASCRLLILELIVLYCCFLLQAYYWVSFPLMSAFLATGPSHAAASSNSQGKWCSAGSTVASRCRGKQ